MVVKVVSLMKRRTDMSLQEFREWLFNQHPAFALALPGLMAYRVNVVSTDLPENEFDGFSEMWFNSEEDYRKAFSSEAGKRAAEDAGAHCSKRLRLILEERILMP